MSLQAEPELRGSDYRGDTWGGAATRSSPRYAPLFYFRLSVVLLEVLEAQAVHVHGVPLHAREVEALGVRRLVVVLAAGPAAKVGAFHQALLLRSSSTADWLISSFSARAANSRLASGLKAALV